MSQGVKIALVVAAALILTGSVIFCCAMAVIKWDFSELATSKIVTSTYDITDAFKDISVNVDTADVVILPAADGKCKVVCDERENAKHTVQVVNEKLSISLNSSEKWYEKFGINFGQTKITVYLPEGMYGALTVVLSTGDVEITQDKHFESIDVTGSTGDVKNYASATGAIKICLSTGSIFTENISAGWCDFSVSTGKIQASNINCNGDVAVVVSTGKANLSNLNCVNFQTTGDTGDLTLENVIASGKISVKRSTGDVTLDGVDAAELLVNMDTGDVTGVLLSDKVFITKTSTGTVDVPQSVSGGKCEVTTSTGDIKLKIK